MTHGRSWLLLVLALLMLAAIPAAPALAQTRFVFANESPYDTLRTTPWTRTRPSTSGGWRCA